MIGSEKTAGRRQAGKIKKPADFSTEGKTAGRISWRGTTWFRAEAARTHFPSRGTPLPLKKIRRHRSAATFSVFRRSLCTGRLLSGGRGERVLLRFKAFFVIPVILPQERGICQGREEDFCGEFAQGAEIGRQPRRPQAGERGAPAGGAPKAGEARRAAARSGTRAGFIGRRGCVLPYLRPAVRHGLPGHFGRWLAAGLPHRGSGAPGAESGRG